MDPNVIWFTKFYKCGIWVSKIWQFIFIVNCPKVLFYAFDFMTTHRKINLGTCNTQYNSCKNGIPITYNSDSETKIFVFSDLHLADDFIQSDLQLQSGYTFLISMCVPRESNPQPFALLTEYSTTEPHRNIEEFMIWRIYDTFMIQFYILQYNLWSFPLQVYSSQLEED